ncbi:MAG TPA: FlgD immunoglobulin-like domain containing protein [Chitinophagaceae bacterium]|nr:FlgD immunoglobulin-like domain containing protein [Chitinophagaceae bacterium]
MKHRSIQKLFAFIITVMMFFMIPELASAQKTEPANAEKKCKGCPRGYVCYHGHCITWWPTWSLFATTDETLSASASQGNTINFQIEQPEFVSIKLLDVKGRLIKTLVNRRMTQGEHQIEWDKKDEQGKAVPAGIYVLQIVANGKSETMKLSIIK